MPHSFREGDTVQIADREPTATDSKSQLFFAHYRGVQGTLSKIYPDGTALLIADPASLPEDARTRHAEGTDAMRRKWLDGLSEEGRNRLSATEKKFALRYSVLVGMADLRAVGSAPDAPALSHSAPAAQSAAPSDAPPRKTTEELTAEEDRHLSELRKQKSRG